VSEDTNSGARAVVGIGASAGGLGAFLRFIKALPPDSGMAFVLVQHLDPAYPSELANILSSATKMPVAAARDGEPVRPDRVYVLPSDSLLTLSGGRLRLTARADGHPPVIDQFLTSLAADRGKDAIAVILSGSGSDGAKGVRAVKAAGGATFAQDPTSAEHADMPRNAIESGAIDYVMAPEEIAWAVLDPGARAGATQSSTAAQAQAEAEAFEEITGLLQAATGVNFRHYRVSTLRRRIERRLSIHHLGDLVSYATLLRRDAGAVAALYQEVLLCSAPRRRRACWATSFRRATPSAGFTSDRRARRDCPHPS
jgi:two-component system CheB/CheR fusion protein